jgi:hypothetical protein
MKITPNRHLQTNSGSQAPMAYDELRDDTRDTRRCVVGPSCCTLRHALCLRCTVIALRAAVSVLLHVFTYCCMCLRMATCSPCLPTVCVVLLHLVMVCGAQPKATLTWATTVLELWVSKRCKASGGYPNLPISGYEHCRRHGGGVVVIPPKCTSEGCQSTCEGDQKGKLCCFKHGGTFYCYVSGCTEYRCRESGHSTKFCLQHQQSNSRPGRQQPFQTPRQKQVVLHKLIEEIRGLDEESSYDDRNEDSNDEAKYDTVPY